MRRSSTADRSPPIVMSSLCTVATTCSPLMCPEHDATHSRQLEIAGRRREFSPPNFVRHRACHTSCIAAARTCAQHLPGSPLAEVRRLLSFVLERRLSASQPMPLLFLHICPWRSPTAQPSAPQAASSTRATLVACVLYSFATHLARTLGFPGCPVSVSVHPVLMGALPASRRQVSL